MKKLMLFMFMVFLSACGDKNIGKETLIQINKINTESINLDSVFTDLKLIKLDTSNNFLLKRVKKVIFDDYIYVTDGDVVCVFDTLGNGIKRFDAVGKAKYEYLLIRDLEITDNRVFILDPDSRKILVYDKDFQFITSLKIDTYLSSFAAKDDNTLFADNNYFVNENGDSKKFTSISVDEMLYNNFYDIDKDKSNYLHILANKYFYKNGSEILFFEPYNNEVLTLTDSASVKYKIDFTTYQVPENFYKAGYEDIVDFSRRFNQTDYATGVHDFIDMENDIIFKFLYRRQMYYCRYGKKDNEVKWIGRLTLFDDVDSSIEYTNGKFFCKLDFDKLLALKDSNSDVAQYLNENDINEDSNLPLIVMKLK